MNSENVKFYKQNLVKNHVIKSDISEIEKKH